MSTAKRFIALMLCALLSAPATLAQTPQRNSQTDNAVSPDVLIIIQQQQVRFTAQKAVEWMQLQVVNPSGELVFDSGQVAAGELTWPFQNGNGEAIKSGLYAYTLSIKGISQESGAEAARVRRGHFIVDRAKDRDGGADKLWVTSQNDNGVGTELTVSRDENTSVAGAIAPRREADIERGAVERDGEGKAEKDEKAAQAELAVAGAGTPGQIAKFISAEEVGGSVMTEVEGKIGIGTINPASSRLTIEGQDALTVQGYEPFITFLDSNHGNARGAIQQVNGGLNLFTDSYSRGTNPFGYLRLDNSGNVGIGTANPLHKLHVSGPATGLRLESTNSNFWTVTEYATDARIWHAGVGGSAVSNDLKSKYYIYDGTAGQARMVVDTRGFVGIGTTNPLHKLHVSGPATGLRLESTNSNFWTVTEYATDARIWHAGVGGSAVSNDLKSKYYIYDANAGRVRLAIDTNGLVSVNALQITGGADFAENFDIGVAPESSEAMTKVEAGFVVSIDPDNPGRLALSTQAYDSQVAGIISGAGGVKPGMVMSQEGTLAEGKYPVALSGRVFCRADASNGPIKPGDLLTTSAMPGHAMKATDRERAQGAIIGKAMTGLKEGKGLVLVLVTLQ